MSRHYGFTIISDDAYQFLNYTINAVPLWMEEDKDNVIALGSFSKIFGPGLRLGWIQANSDKIDRLAHTGFVVSGGGLNPIIGEVARSFIECGFQDKHLAFLKENYKLRCQALCDAVNTFLPKYTSYKQPEGGFFLWIKLPEAISSADLLEKAKRKGVAFKPGSLFSNEKGLNHYLRLSFSYYSPELITEGVRRLAIALTEKE
jgi:2-aminoadipate transaminase